MDCATKYIIAIILVLNFIGYGKSYVKIWTYDVDIYNPSNWVDGKAQARCEGLNLSENYHSVMTLEDLSVTKIIFPSHGVLRLKNAHIEFNELGKSIMDCVRVKELNDMNYWMDPAAWITKGEEGNVAIPHYERVPCQYDDVIFPKGYKSGYCFVEEEIEVKSIKFGDFDLDPEDLGDDLIFGNSAYEVLDITEKTCKDPTGCICREHFIDCSFVEDTIYFSCLNPIEPIGFCSKMCGASILLKPKSNFRIADVRESLKHYSSDTYVSKVYNGSVEAIQIIFAEKQFSGSSLEDAKDYFGKLLDDDTVEEKSVKLQSSGPYFIEGETTRNALSVVFGSLCGVVLVFAILFLLYSPRFAALNLGDRISLSSRPLSSFRRNLFARYNTENAELILERHSLAGSVISLDKSFDNPMFGKSTPSTASTSYGTIYTPSDKVTRSEISLENPMYEINTSVESVQEATEEDFADLIQGQE